MPELPEVETTRRGIAPSIEGRTIAAFTAHDRRLRWPVPEQLEALLPGLTIHSVTRRAKYLLLQCHRVDTLIGTLLIHLGMSGSLRLCSPDTPRKTHDHLIWRFHDSDWEMRFHDPRRFGCCLWLSDQQAQQPNLHPLLAKLGPEPLTARFDGDWLYTLSRNKNQPIKSFIMDNQVVVGVGNIYANEVLFLSGIHPTRAAGRISQARYRVLADNIKTVLSAAIAQGGTTLRDFVNSDGNPGYFQQTLHVYGRAGQSCLVCTTTLTEIRMSGRSTVFCPQCQH